MMKTSKRNRRLATIAALLAISAAAAHAQNSVGVRQAIESAIENNLTSRLAKADSDAARAEVLQTASALLPNIIGTAFQNRIFKQSLAQEGFTSALLPGVPTLIGPYDSFDARLRLSQTIFDVSSIKRYQAAGAGRDMAAKQEDVAREQVAAAAALAYVEALRAGKAVAAAQADVELAGSLLSQAEDQERNGTATGVDVARAKTRSSDAKVALLRAQVVQRNALIRLKRVAGWPLAKDIALSDDLAQTPSAAVPLDGLLAQAAQARPEIAAAQEQSRLDGLLLSAAKSERLPTIVGNADIGLAGNLPNKDARTTGSIGAGLSIPIFPGGAVRGRIDKAQAEKDRSEARLVDVRAQVEEDVRLADDNLAEASEQVQAAIQTLHLAQEELRMAQDQYAAGTTDNVAIVTAQAELAQARDGFVASLAGDYDARINLASALGAARDFKLP